MFYMLYFLCMNSNEIVKSLVDDLDKEQLFNNDELVTIDQRLTDILENNSIEKQNVIIVALSKVIIISQDIKNSTQECLAISEDPTYRSKIQEVWDRSSNRIKDAFLEILTQIESSSNNDTSSHSE